MKKLKTWLGIFGFALLFLFGMNSTLTVRAADYFEVKVLGETVASAEGVISQAMPEGMTIDTAAHIITLEDVTIVGDPEEGTDGISISGSDFTLCLKGNNTIKGTNSGILSYNTMHITGDGALNIEPVYYGIMTAGLKMTSGNLHLTSPSSEDSINVFYGISYWASSMESERQFEFLGGTVDIQCGDTPSSNLHVGIDSQNMNMVIKNTTIRMDLGKAANLIGIGCGYMGYIPSTDEDKSFGGKLTIDHAFISIKASKADAVPLTAYVYELNDVSDSYYYVGDSVAGKNVDKMRAFKESEYYEGRRDCTYKYLTISPDPVEIQMAFDDVKEGDWYYDYVEYAFKNNLMTGLDEKRFGPVQQLARAQFAVILHRMNDEPAIEYTEKFQDVGDDIWYTDAILWANSIGVVNGYSNSKMFGPADDINREQMAVMMYRYADYKGYDISAAGDFSKFSDALSVNDFAKDAMKWAVGTGIITGKDNGKKLDPQGYASRAECATIMMRFMEKYGE